MKAILIDVTARTVTDIELPPGLQAMYNAIGCSCVDRITIDSRNDVWIDDSGLLHDPQPPKFQFFGAANVIAGNGLICGYSPAGETVSTTLRAEQVRPFIVFLGDVPVDPDPILILSWDDR